MDFSAEEIDFLSDLFKSDQKPALPHEPMLTMQSSVPVSIAQLLSNANLTLLAEVAHYQLWFPLHLKINSSGTITPTLSAPEVIDTKGTQRSWRWSHLNIKSQGFCIESISSTGVFLKPTGKYKNLSKVQHVEFTLPNKESVSMDIEPVRQSKHGLAAKIKHIHTGKEQLRAYLFAEHQRQYANLYQYEPLINSPS
ncbi:MAG: hypothetical protein ACTH36_04490 [Pseudoalteromonas nigrifaciens]